jgi:diguanylate cyclase (GGDEF)-like protein
VARVVAFLFLASVAVVVALTGAWPETQAAIFTLLAAGMLLVVLFMDMIPPAALGRWRRPAEGIGAIVFLGLLMALSGGSSSPFLVGFFLVVAGTALSTEGRAPLTVATVGAATIGLVGLLDVFDGPIEPESLAWVGIGAVSLILLADIATAAARTQRQARDEALRASRFDSLTGLYNRTFFFTTMEQEIRRSDRMGRGFTMLMLDLDDLKPVNDTFGHQWGDRLLKAVADTIRQTVRFTDAAARYGGDEFVVLLPETDAAGGYVVGEKLRRDIAGLALNAADRNVRSSVSVGLVTYPDDGSTIEQLVAAADVAMYESKRRGKNRIVGYQTRIERVATAIDDAATAELVQLTPASDVRTGGDPAPWNTAASEEPDREAYGERPLPGMVRRSDDRGTIPIESDSRDATPWSSGAASTTGSSPTDLPAPGALPRQADDDRPSARAHDPSRDAQGRLPRPPDTEVGLADQPWLTRTDAGPRPMPPPSGEQRPADEATRHPGHPASQPRTSSVEGDRRTQGRSSDGSPWIALPIEPYDPPERPRG